MPFGPWPGETEGGGGTLASIYTAGLVAPDFGGDNDLQGDIFHILFNEHGQLQQKTETGSEGFAGPFQILERINGGDHGDSFFHYYYVDYPNGTIPTLADTSPTGFENFYFVRSEDGSASWLYATDRLGSDSVWIGGPPWFGGTNQVEPSGREPNVNRKLQLVTPDGFSNTIHEWGNAGNYSHQVWIPWEDFGETPTAVTAAENVDVLFEGGLPGPGDRTFGVGWWATLQANTDPLTHMWNAVYTDLTFEGETGRWDLWAIDAGTLTQLAQFDFDQGITSRPGVVTMHDGSSATEAPPGQGAFRYDDTSTTLQGSVDGNAWKDVVLVTAGSTAGELLFSDGAGGWTYSLNLDFDDTHQWLNLGGLATPFSGALAASGLSVRNNVNQVEYGIVVNNDNDTGHNAGAGFLVSSSSTITGGGYFTFNVYGPGNTTGAPYGPQAGAMIFNSHNGANLIFANQSLGSPPGGDIVFEAGTAATEGFRLKGGGQLQFRSPNFAANGAVATVLGSVGPAGANTTVQEWLAFQNNAGVTRYIPCF